MRARRPGWAACRAAIAVAALYAVVLQALLGGMAATAALDPTHVICAADAGSGDGSSKPQSGHGHLPCCTVAHVACPAGPPPLSPIAFDWPQRRSVVVTWRPEVVAAPRAPPGVGASARAPPVA